MDLAALHEEWITADPVQVGKVVLGALTPQERVARALAMLDLCRACCPPIAAVDVVMTIGSNAGRWREAHRAFQDVRGLTLLEERKPTNRAYGSLLFVAENTAKTIFNASGEPAPFDEDAPWWLASNVLHLARTVRDSGLQEALWRALTGTDP